jgi:hypothetical protein
MSDVFLLEYSETFHFSCGSTENPNKVAALSQDSKETFLEANKKRGRLSASLLSTSLFSLVGAPCQIIFTL